MPTSSISSRTVLYKRKVSNISSFSDYMEEEIKQELN